MIQMPLLCTKTFKRQQKPDTRMKSKNEITYSGRQRAKDEKSIVGSAVQKVKLLASGMNEKMGNVLFSDGWVNECVEDFNEWTREL